MDNEKILAILKEAMGKIDEAVSLLSPPSPPSDTKPEPPSNEQHAMLDTLRTKLAQLAGNGNKAAVKKLLNKYGCSKISAVKPEDYDALMKDIVEVENAK